MVLILNRHTGTYERTAERPTEPAPPAAQINDMAPTGARALHTVRLGVEVHSTDDPSDLAEAQRRLDAHLESLSERRWELADGQPRTLDELRDAGLLRVSTLLGKASRYPGQPKRRVEAAGPLTFVRQAPSREDAQQRERQQARMAQAAQGQPAKQWASPTARLQGQVEELQRQLDELNARR
jgi:hypothetical protein